MESQRRPSASQAPDPPEELTVITTRAASLDYPRPSGLYNSSSQASPNHINTPVSAQPAFNFSRPSPLGRTPQDGSLLTSGPPSARSGSSASVNFPSIMGGSGHVSPQPYGHNAPVNYKTEGLSTSQLAAQTAVLQHQASHDGPSHTMPGPVHSRQRSQTVPAPGEELAVRARTGPLSPPMLSLTEASAPRDYNHGLLGATVAATAANAVFPRVTTSVLPSSPNPNIPDSPHVTAPSPLTSTPPSPLPPQQQLEKKEPKRKLFSRPGKISVKDTKERALPSPGKIGSAFSSALQRGNYSTTNLSTSEGAPGSSSSLANSLYAHTNSSSVTIRVAEGDSNKDKEKKHHFLSRQKQKLKEEYHAASGTTPKSSSTSLYNFHATSPASSTSAFKSHHGARKDKKNPDRLDIKLGEADPSFDLPPAVLATIHADMQEAKLASLNQLGLEDAWPYLRSKIFVVFEGEEVRVPIEDLNRIVLFHLQLCITRRMPTQLLEDLKELFTSGFMALDRAMRKTSEDRTIPELVEFWMFTFTVVLPYLQAVFLPLDVEFSGNGTLVSKDQALEFWGAVAAVHEGRDMPVIAPLNIRGLVLTAYRDIVVLPRYETLKTIFSRLSLEFLPASLANMALASPPPEASNINISASPSESYASIGRPGTAASMPLGGIDAQFGSFNSAGSTLPNDMGGHGNTGSSSVQGTSVGTRSRAISNVSYGSNMSDSVFRPFTPSSLHINISNTLGAGVSVLGVAQSLSTSMINLCSTNGERGGAMSVTSLGSVREVREQNVEDSKQVTELVGRMLQCMSVLSSVGVGGTAARDEGSEKMRELSRLLKLNWLGRGRTGRNRRGMVGGRVRRGAGTEAMAMAMAM